MIKITKIKITKTKNQNKNIAQKLSYRNNITIPDNSGMLFNTKI